MRDFIRLQLKLKWGLNRNNNKTSAVMTAVAAFLAVVVALGLVLALTYVLNAAFIKEGIAVSAKRLSVLYLTIIMIGLTVAATGMQMRRLCRPGDLFITARFPLSPFKQFICHLILNYIDLAIYSVVLVVPVMVVFGIAMKCITFVYILGVILGALFMPLIPFALSIFIAIPVMYLVTLLERHTFVMLGAFVIVLVGAFLLYDYILTVLAQFFIHRNWETGTLEIWNSLLTGMDAYYNPAYYLGNMIFFERFGLGIGALLGAALVLIAGGVALARVVCTSFRNKALDSGFGVRVKRTKVDGYGSARAIFRYQFKEILRTKTYSYFYLGVAISTPVMVFFCNRLVSLVGEAQIGPGFNFGVSMLVVAVFMAMICSFTGSVLSVEGKKFYITKLVPVGYRKQLLIKGLLNIAVSVIALIISAIVMASLKFLSGAEMAVLLVTQLVLAAGLVFNGINLNLANPNLKPKANGEAEEINITYMLLIGLVVAALLGSLSIILPDGAGSGTTAAYLIAVAIAVFYTALNFVVFWFTADKKYRKIEV